MPLSRDVVIAVLAVAGFSSVVCAQKAGGAPAAVSLGATVRITHARAVSASEPLEGRVTNVDDRGLTVRIPARGGRGEALAWFLKTPVVDSLRNDSLGVQVPWPDVREVRVPVLQPRSAASGAGRGAKWGLLLGAVVGGAVAAITESNYKQSPNCLVFCQQNVGIAVVGGILGGGVAGVVAGGVTGALIGREDEAWLLVHDPRLVPTGTP